MKRNKHHHPNLGNPQQFELLDIVGLIFLGVNVWVNLDGLRVSKEHVAVNKQVLKQLEQLNITEMNK